MALLIQDVPDDLDPPLGSPVLSWKIGWIPLTGGDLTANRSILLIGDSHMAVWQYGFDMIGQFYNYTVHLSWYPSCPPIAVGQEGLGSPCPAVRKTHKELIRSLKPEFVFMTHTYTHRGPDLDKLKLEYRDLLKEIDNTITTPVIISDNPYCGIHIENCLLASPHQVQHCSCSLQEAVKTEWLEPESLVAESLGVTFVDISSLFCTPERCPPIVRNTRVLMDTNHPTPSYLVYVLPKFMELLYQRDVRFTHSR